MVLLIRGNERRLRRAIGTIAGEIPSVSRRKGVQLQGTGVSGSREKAGHDLSPGVLPKGFVSVEIEVTGSTAAKDRRLVDLTSSAGVLLTSVERKGRYRIPKSDAVFAGCGKVWGVARQSSIDTLKEVIGAARLA